jgi:LuxR family maltose regulon positive regulatory protein
MAYAAREAGRTHLVSGELVAAARMLELAEDTSDDLALAAVLLGDRAATAYWLDHRSSRTEAWIPDVFDAVHSLDRDRAEQSLLELRSRWTGAETWWPLAAWAAAEHALVWRGRSRMLAELATARGSAARRRDTPWLHGLLVAAEANLATSLGRTAVAGRLLADVQPGSVQGLLARARLERVTGRPQEALALLDAAATLADPSAVVELESLVLRAWCLDATAAGAADALAQAVEHARDSRVLLPFAHVPPAFLDRHVRAVSGLGQVVALLREAGVRSPYDLVDEPPAITPREAAVLQALARGLSLEQVGRELFVSRNTVKSQVASLYRKLQVSGRTEAVRKARRMGLLD